MLGWAQHPVDRREVGDDFRVRAVRFDIGRKPADPVIVADHDLKSPPAIFERPGELGLPLAGDRVVAEKAERMELATGDVRGCVGRKRRGVDGDGEPRLLHQPGG